MIALKFDIHGKLLGRAYFDTHLSSAAVKRCDEDTSIHDDWSQYDRVIGSCMLGQTLLEDSIQKTRKIVDADHHCSGDFVKEYLDRNPGSAKKGALDKQNELRGKSRFLRGFTAGSRRHTTFIKMRSAGFDTPSAGRIIYCLCAIRRHSVLSSGPCEKPQARRQHV